MFQVDFLFLLFLLCSLSLGCLAQDSSAYEPNSPQQICADIQFGNRFILVVGLLATRIVLITTPTKLSGSHYYLHDMPPEALSASLNVLYLNEGTWVRDHWSPLYHLFAHINFVFNQICTLQVGHSGCVYVSLPHRGAAYDIDRSVMVNFTDIHPMKFRWISCADELSFYGLNSAMAIAKFHFTLKDSTGIYQIVQQSPFLTLCQNADENHLSFVESGCAERYVLWKVSNGFADDSRLYLFEANNVRIIQLDAMDGQVGEQVPVTTVPMVNFIHCPGQPNPPIPNGLTKKPSHDSPRHHPKHHDPNPFVTDPRFAADSKTSGASAVLITVGVIFLVLLIIVPACVVFAFVFMNKKTHDQGTPGNSAQCATSSVATLPPAKDPNGSIAKSIKVKVPSMNLPRGGSSKSRKSVKGKGVAVVKGSQSKVSTKSVSKGERKAERKEDMSSYSRASKKKKHRSSKSSTRKGARRSKSTDKKRRRTTSRNSSSKSKKTKK